MASECVYIYIYQRILGTLHSTINQYKLKLVKQHPMLHEKKVNLGIFSGVDICLYYFVDIHTVLVESYSITNLTTVLYKYSCTMVCFMVLIQFQNLKHRPLMLHIDRFLSFLM